jgi:hypothetical protein
MVQNTLQLGPNNSPPRSGTTSPAAEDAHAHATPISSGASSPNGSSKKSKSIINNKTSVKNKTSV